MKTFELTDKEVEVIRTALGWYYDQAWLDEQIAEINEVAPRFGMSFEKVVKQVDADYLINAGYCEQAEAGE